MQRRPNNGSNQENNSFRANKEAVCPRHTDTNEEDSDGLYVAGDALQHAENSRAACECHKSEEGVGASVCVVTRREEMLLKYFNLLTNSEGLKYLYIHYWYK